MTSLLRLIGTRVGRAAPTAPPTLAGASDGEAERRGFAGCGSR